ncbi:hypothetical protein BDV09DRAFT_171482 [Aspergillus tetrazonus]
MCLTTAPGHAFLTNLTLFMLSCFHAHLLSNCTILCISSYQSLPINQPNKPFRSLSHPLPTLIFSI